MNLVLKAELRKFLTIRSTYVLTALAIVFIVLIDFLTGYKTHSSPFNPHAFDSHAYISAAFGAIGVASLFSAIASVLVMAHEYRYNTIMYTLTASNSRSKVLASKVAVVTAYSAIIAIPLVLLGILSFHIGVSLQNVPLPPQTFDAPYILGRCLYYLIAYSLTGLLFATLIRNLVGAIAVLFLVPGIVESLLALLIKSKNQYLPFTSLKQVILDPGQIPPNIHFYQTNHPLRSAVTFLVYLLIGWAVGWYLFLKRDAL
ncbi:MAG TPA: ABC transporter permease [Candidatus Binatia bacterium]|nr:ABC transporter permease [Candidatus Binatia bacterium]